MKIKRNSWHFRFIEKECNPHYSAVTNSCQYIALFLKALFLTSVKTLGILTLVAMLGFFALPLLLLATLSTLLFIPEMIYQAAYGESLYQIVVTLSGDQWLWLGPTNYEPMFILGLLGNMVLSVPLSTSIIGFTKNTARSVRSKIHISVPAPLHDLNVLFKSRFVDKICLPVSIVDEMGIGLINMNMIRDGKYHWKHNHEPKLVYLGKSRDGACVWNQFAKVNDPTKEVWCEVLDEGLHLMEETKEG